MKLRKKKNRSPPPPMGDIGMDEAFAIVGNQMALEGNIETHAFMTGDTGTLHAKIHAALNAGRRHRLILCPSSGYMENTEPTPAEIENWVFYINEGVRYAREVSK